MTSAFVIIFVQMIRKESITLHISIIMLAFQDNN